MATRPVRCIQAEAASHLYLAGRAMIPIITVRYLLPIVRSGKVALVSTANKAPQGSSSKDIPFISSISSRFPRWSRAWATSLPRSLEEERAFQPHAPDSLRQDGGIDWRLWSLGRRPRPPADGARAGYTFARRCRQRTLCLAGAFYPDCYCAKCAGGASRVIVVNHTLLRWMRQWAASCCDAT